MKKGFKILIEIGGGIAFLAFAGGAVAVGGAIAIRRKYRNAYLPRNYRTR